MRIKELFKQHQYRILTVLGGGLFLVIIILSIWFLYGQINKAFTPNQRVILQQMPQQFNEEDYNKYKK